MEKPIPAFDENRTLKHLKHYLPSQAPLKDFIHHNTLHAFQDLPFKQALNKASVIFGYRVSLSLNEYRNLFKQGKIHPAILERVLQTHKGEQAGVWRDKLLSGTQPSAAPQVRIGQLRKNWKERYNLDLDQDVHPLLFRLTCSYLDQGISIWNYPMQKKGFLESVREMQRQSYTGILTSSRAKKLLDSPHCTVESLLHILVGEPALYEQYLFDQQFAHPGWSGMCAVLEHQPESLLSKRKISLKELITLELLLEIDALDRKFRGNWSPLALKLESLPGPLFNEVEQSEFMEVHHLWQEIVEWSYYDQVLSSIRHNRKPEARPEARSFQAMFCIDDRECSLRRYVEQFDPACETFGTPGFFGVEFYYQPEKGKFHTKLCPAPVRPKHLIKELAKRGRRREREVHFSKHSHNLFTGWLITQTLGFWSAFKLFLNIFWPSTAPASTSSFRHMDRFSQLSYQNYNPHFKEGELQIGFTVEEMADRVEAVLHSIGLVRNFAKLIYVVGHGASSVNNTHYAGYDCGACSGRPGSVNARVFAHMANHPKVRARLEEKGLQLPKDCHFVAALHDTTRDEIEFYDEAAMPWLSVDEHLKHQFTFKRALAHNAKERARRFESIDLNWSLRKIYKKIQLRSTSLFEPRPELNHATNSLCIVGRRSLSKGLFLDRRVFLNSHDYRIDPDGRYLAAILRAVAPVCGGINLEYYFSRVDNQKLGAGSKLPHNVMGLFGVANGIDGDLRTGLPLQMIELHDPIRLLVVVEHYPEVLLEIFSKEPSTREWFDNQWIHLALLHPDSNAILVYRKGNFAPYEPLSPAPERISDLKTFLQNPENLPVEQLPL